MAINPFQPLRPKIHPDTGHPLLYRTHPPVWEGRQRPKTCDHSARITQCRLYRWCRSLDFERFIKISDLYDYLFADHPLVSKHVMGRTVVISLTYNPRVTVAPSKRLPTIDKVSSCYLFFSYLDLQYGLEWQICSWMRKLTSSHLGFEIRNKEQMENVLDDVAECDEEEFLEKYVKTSHIDIEEIPWKLLLLEHGEIDREHSPAARSVLNTQGLDDLTRRVFGVEEPATPNRLRRLY